MHTTAGNSFYLDMGQFSELKMAARENDAEATNKVAQQFEGLMLQMMLKNMRAASVIDESQHSSYMDFYQELYDRQLAQQLAQNGGLGFGRILTEQLQPSAAQGNEFAATDADALTHPSQRSTTSSLSGLQSAAVDELAIARLDRIISDPESDPCLPLSEMNYQPENNQVKTTAYLASAETQSNESLNAQTVEPFYGWDEAQQYVNDLWPHAQRAAETLGVSTEVLVAQSVLETGWGRHAMRKPDGSVAFNLFGIKAGNDWSGQQVVHKTLEYKQGAMQSERASFRAYDTVSDAVDDYVEFLSSRGRYQQAISEHNGDDKKFIQGLQQAGYATDPDYADKVLRIMNSDTLASVAAQNTHATAVEVS